MKIIKVRLALIRLVWIKLGLAQVQVLFSNRLQTEDNAVRSQHHLAVGGQLVSLLFTEFFFTEFYQIHLVPITVWKIFLFYESAGTGVKSIRTYSEVDQSYRVSTEFFLFLFFYCAIRDRSMAGVGNKRRQRCGMMTSHGQVRGQVVSIFSFFFIGGGGGGG